MTTSGLHGTVAGLGDGHGRPRDRARRGRHLRPAAILEVRKPGRRRRRHGGPADDARGAGRRPADGTL